MLQSWTPPPTCNQSKTGPTTTSVIHCTVICSTALQVQFLVAHYKRNLIKMFAVAHYKCNLVKMQQLAADFYSTERRSNAKKLGTFVIAMNCISL